MKKFLLTLLCLLTASLAVKAETRDVTIKGLTGTLKDGSSVKFGTSSLSYTNKIYLTNINAGDILSMIPDIGTNTSNSPSYNKNGDLRLYPNNKITFKANTGFTFSKLEFTMTQATGTGSGVKYEAPSHDSGSGSLTGTTYTWTSDTPVSEMTLTASSTVGKQFSFTGFKITYENADPSQPLQCAAPVAKVGNDILIDESVVLKGKSITLSSSTEDATITYTLISDNINISEEKYTEPIILNEVGGYLFEAYAEKDGYTKSAPLSLSFEITDKGSFDNPLSVADIINGNNNLGDNIWVRGYIIGSITDSKLDSNGSTASNFAFADSKDEKNNYVPVQLANNTAARNALNPGNNIGEEVMICGNSEAYFQKPGIKSNNLKYIFLSKNPEMPVIEDQEFINHNDKTIQINANASANIKLKVNESVDIWYSLGSHNTDTTPTDAEISALADNDHNHGEYLKYDESKGIDVNSNHTTISFYSCNPITLTHHAEEPVVYAVVSTSSAVAEIETEAGEARYFDLQGREVKGDLQNGVYVRVANGKATKILVK